MDNFRFKDLFSFSKRERRGIYTLLAVLMVLLIVRVNIHVFIPHDNEPRDPDFIHEVSAFWESRKEPAEQKEESREIQFSEFKYPAAKLFEFDPNTISEQELRRLGLSDKQIQTILNYRQSGGKFYKKEDLKKIYGISEEIYKRLDGYIKIAKQPERTTEAPRTAKKSMPIIEINAADTFQLALIRGIGPSYARRICKYRDLLGGYHSKAQLSEVYGISGKLLSDIDSIISVDKDKIIQININEAEFRDLIRHPYLNEYKTQAILQYRRFKGRIDSMDELLSNNVLDRETYSRMRPYLKIEEEH